MSTGKSVIRQTYRINIDIEATVSAEPFESPDVDADRYYQALLQSLQAHPSLLDQLLRSKAVDSLKEARKMIEAEYGWERISEQELLSSVLAELEPEAQAYFTEEIEAGVNTIYFDGYQAVVKQFRVSKVDSM